ncbi:hypothetical protein [Paraburkholderia youngii]|uniref:hypothetical protein n=1 Tax=Paraburkholderia youngii TaxID=2782701 RepID=UPI003D1C1E3B
MPEHAAGDVGGEHLLPFRLAGQRARKRREEIGESRRGVAFAVGVSDLTLARWENRGISSWIKPEAVKMWESALQVSPGWLLGKHSQVVEEAPRTHTITTGRRMSVAASVLEVARKIADKARVAAHTDEIVERNGLMFAQRYGIAPAIGNRFAAIGAHHGVTEGLVSRIHKRHLELCRTCAIVVPAIERLESEARAHLPCESEALGALLRRTLGDGPTIEDVGRFTMEVLGRPLFGFDTQSRPGGEATVVVDPSQSDAGTQHFARERHMKGSAQAMIRATGAAHMGLLLAYALDRGWDLAKARAVRGVLQQQKGFEWLEEGTDGPPQWFWFSEEHPGRNPVIEATRKLFSVSNGPLVAETVLGAVNRMRVQRAARQQLASALGAHPPRDVTIKLLERLSFIEQPTPGNYRGTPGLVPRTELTDLEHQVYKALERRGGVVSRAVLIQELALRTEDESIDYVLTHSPIIKRLTRGLYLLRGSRLAAEDGIVTRMRP